MKSKEHENFITETQSYWSEQYGEEITEDCACEIIGNISNFYSVLRECKQRKSLREAGIHDIG